MPQCVAADKSARSLRWRNAVFVTSGLRKAPLWRCLFYCEPNVCFRPIADIGARWDNSSKLETAMTLPSLRLPMTAVLAATLMAWRAYEIAPEHTAVQVKMAGWMMLGAVLLTVGFFWELARWYLRMDRRYAPER